MTNTLRYKLFIIFLVLIFIFVPVLSSLASIKILINNDYLKSDVDPQIKNGRTFVPIRAVLEAFDAELTWNQASQTVKVIKNNNVIMISVGQS